VFAAALLVATTGVVPVVAEAAADGCDTGSWVAGTTNLCAGDIVYRDYVYDDYGADTGGLASTTFLGGSITPTGDVRYPQGAEDTADLRQLRLSVQGNRLVATFTLNALYQSGSTIGALVIDTDDNAGTGGGSWPTVQIASAGWEVAGVFRQGASGVIVDTVANTITGSIPLPGGTRWRIQAVVAQPDGKVMNAGFRGTNEHGPWFEDLQAAALQSGSIDGFGYRVAVGDLTAHVTRLAAVPAGLHERVYRSAKTVGSGEGMTYQGVPGNGNLLLGQYFHFVGPYQPYAIYIPDEPGPHGLQLALHGMGSSITSIVAAPGFQQQFGAARNRILVTPLGLGPMGWYTGPSERDAIDVLDDAEQNYAVDHDHEIVSGYSMGGYGTYLIAELNPDRFAGFIDWVGYSDCLNGTPLGGACPIFGAVGNPIDYVGNLRWVPGGMLYSGADEIVLVTTAIGVQQAFAAAGNPYIWWLHPVAEHATYSLLDNWQKESAYSATMTRVHNPPRVTYRYNPLLDDPAYGVVHDHAYWLSQLHTSAAGVGDVDLTTAGCGGSLPTTAPTNGANLGLDPVPWTSVGAAVVGFTPLPQAPRLTGTLTNVGSVRIDSTATCLTGAAVSYDITTSGTSSLSFSDGRTLTLSGAGAHTGTLL
jgi:hypothetical protein